MKSMISEVLRRTIWLLVLASGAVQSAEDPWIGIRQIMFGDRPIREDSAEVIRLTVATRAEDAAVVPVTIRTRLEQTPERYVKTIWLVIDNNPSPMGVKFSMTPESGRADIETRVRLEYSSPMRVIAELNDGSLWMHSSVVFGSGGCSTPVAKNEQVMKNLGRMKFTVDTDNLSTGAPVLAQLRVSHPQFSGIGARAMGARFIRQVNVFHGDRKVMSADLDFTISENPSFRFYFLPTGKGELRAEIVDTEELRFEQSLELDGPGASPAVR